MSNFISHSFSRGFTLIEVVVVIVIISILVGLGGATYINQQEHATATTRVARAKTIATALEQYYSRNGEYPGVGIVAQTSATNVSTILRIDKKDIVDPTAATGTNSIVNYENYSSSTATVFRYRGYAANLTTCRTSTTTGYCEAFILSYRDTLTNQWKEIRSVQGQSLLP